MKDFCCLWPVVAICFLAGVERLAGAPAPPPNIVLIMADDLGVNDLGCYGRPDIPTPHLDRLAAGGMRFNAAYAPAPLCSASRASLLTGKWPARLQLTSFLPGRADTTAQKLLQPRQEGQLPVEETTLAEALQAAGFATACFGKWHLGEGGFGPRDQGFQIAEAGETNTIPSSTEGSKGTMGLASKSEAFIVAHRHRPFFLYLAHDSPHIPFAAAPEAIRRHEERGSSFNPSYGAEVEWLDASVGRVLAALEANGLMDRTLVIFTSDNGGLHVPELQLPPPTHNTPYRAGKGFLFEGGLRVPLLVQWPGVVAAGEVRGQPVTLTDLMPTLLAAAGFDPAKVSGPLDGRDLLPLWKQSPQDNDDSSHPLYWHFPHYSNQGGRPGGAMREGKWKVIEDYESGALALYDLESDPGEQLNVAAQHPPVAGAMAKRLAAWRDQVGAAMPRPNPVFSEAAAHPLYQETDVTQPLEGAFGPDHAWHTWRRAMDSITVGCRPAVTPARGDVRLQARDARAHGSKLRYEPEAWKNTLGYWVEEKDWAEWDLTIPADGRYEIEIQQGCGEGQGGSEVEVAIAGHSRRFLVRDTGHFQRFIGLVIGEVDLKEGPHTLTLRAPHKARDAVVDVRRIVLRPADPRNQGSG